MGSVQVSRWRRVLSRIVVGACGIAVCWLLGDFAYARYVTWRYRAWEQSVVRDADGVRVGCRAYTIGKGRIGVLLVHGFADSPRVWRKIAPSLAARGYTCRVMRLRGFAEPLPRYREGDCKTWLAAISDELRSLRASHEHVYVVAHSLGAALAARCLGNDPAAASGLVAIAPLFAVSNRRSPLISSEDWFHVLEKLLVFTDTIMLVFDPDVKDRREHQRLQTDRFVPVSIYRELFALIDEIRRSDKTVQQPLLMILGDDDSVIDNQVAGCYFEQCRSEHKTRVVVEGAGHVPPVDFGWRRVVDEIDDFLGRARYP